MNMKVMRGKVGWVWWSRYRPKLLYAIVANLNQMRRSTGNQWTDEVKVQNIYYTNFATVCMVLYNQCWKPSCSVLDGACSSACKTDTADLLSIRPTKDTSNSHYIKELNLSFAHLTSAVKLITHRFRHERPAGLSTAAHVFHINNIEIDKNRNSTEPKLPTLFYEIVCKCYANWDSCATVVSFIWLN